MLSMYKFHEVRRLSEAGMSRTKIAQKLKIDRKTVGKYLKLNAPPRYETRSSAGKVDHFSPYAEVAQSIVTVGGEDLTGSALYLLLVERGYVGSERTVDRRLAAMRSVNPKERFFAQVYEPGEQAQFDFKEKVTLPFRDGPRVIHLHFGTLPFSDAVMIKAFPFRTFEAFIDGIHSFFEHVGGQTKNVRIDNLSPCVKKVLKGSGRLYTDAFERAISYYGFGVLPCEPAKGNQKGDVERDIQTYARRIRLAVRLTGRVFENFSDLNEWLELLVARTRTASCRERLTVEQDKLKPLPSRSSDVLCRVVLTTATSFGTVRIGTSSYSVPDQAIGQSCRVELSGYEVLVFSITDNKKILARHLRKIDGENSILLEHVIRSLVRKPQAMVRWAHRDILFPVPAFGRFYAYLRTIDQASAERQFLCAANFIHYVSLSDIAVGMELVCEQKCSTPLDELKSLLGLNSSPITQTIAQPKIDPRLSQYDSLIPTLQETVA
jgi:transposase